MSSIRGSQILSILQVGPGAWAGFYTVALLSLRPPECLIQRHMLEEETAAGGMFLLERAKTGLQLLLLLFYCWNSPCG